MEKKAKKKQDELGSKLNFHTAKYILDNLLIVEKRNPKKIYEFTNTCCRRYFEYFQQI